MEGEIRVSDDVVSKMGTIMEQLGARFELVLEAVTGVGGRIDAMREEIIGQFNEVGRQIRFLSDRIGENREAIASARTDLGAEMVRLGEMLGATRVDFREQMASVRHELQHELQTAAARSPQRFAEDLARTTADLHSKLKDEVAAVGENLRKEFQTARHDFSRDLPAAAAEVRHEISASADSMVKRLDAELKLTTKALTALSRKFERFDDRITVQTKDQDQRLRKLERRTAAK
jgi:hypothetical protein